MNDIKDAVNELQKVVGCLNGSLDSLFQASDTAVSGLNALGMTNTASAVSSAAKQTHDASESYSLIGIVTGSRLEEVGIPSRELVSVLREESAHRLAVVAGGIANFNGMQDRYWRGLGASTYRDHANLQSQAASELSSHLLKVATAIEDIVTAEAILVVAFYVALIAFIVAIGAAVLQILGIITAGSGLATIFSAITALAVFVGAAVTAFSAYSASLVGSMKDVDETLSNGGSTVFDDHWPSKGTLYSGSSF